MHAKAMQMGLLGIAIFGVGWETGKVMSPYYAATPIVFEDTQPAAGGGEGDLQTLLASPVASISSAPAQAQGKYVASKNSTLFHDASCASAKSIKAENQVWFGSLDEAKASGRSPSSCTLKLLGVSQ